MKSTDGGPQVFTAAELISKKIPDPTWILPDLLPEGLSILAGKPKAGKSWLALDLCQAVSSGESVFGGITTVQGHALYLALEDSERRLRGRLIRVLAGAAPPEEFCLCTSWPRLDKGGLHALDRYLRDHREVTLVVVDTFQKVRPPSGTGGIYEGDYAAVAPLKELADKHGVAILLIHHLRKMPADDPLDTLSGSTGLTGAADTIMVLKRGRTRADAELLVTGRDIDHTELALKFDPEAYRWLLAGDAADFRLSGERHAIIQVLKDAGVPMGPKEVAEATGQSPEAARKMMKVMFDRGEIDRPRHGKYVPR